jgi:hypothetical protein
VRALELEVVVSQVPGVIEVNGLQFFQVLPSGAFQPLTTTDAAGQLELILQSWQLPEVLAVVVAAGADGSGIGVPPMTSPQETDTSVAVPIVPAVC